MKDFINVLYCYAQENQVSRYLQTREYNQATQNLEEDWQSFRAALTAEQTQALDRLLSRESVAERLEDQASFAAGVSIGLNLGRL